MIARQHTALTGHAAHVRLMVSRRQIHGMRTRALSDIGSDIDVAQVVATTAQIQAGAAEPVNSTAYIVLGLLLASFVGTFGVAPRFKSSFKEEDTCDSNCLDCASSVECYKSPTDICTWQR
jgi:hypothetical protein